MTTRLAHPYGLLLDRDRSIQFSFEGQRFEGYAGDTIASALAANDMWLLSRSFKYHRPRGILSMSGDDANSLVQLPDEPNVLADLYKIRDGLTVTGQHYTGSLRSDGGQWIERFAKFLPVGFYYRAFHKPRGIWDFWEKRIRARAGLGVVNESVRDRYYDKEYAFADVAVVGAGAAGVAAAVEAARASRQVVLIERQPILGGSLNHARIDVRATRSVDLAGALAQDLAAVEDRITIMTDATCTGLFDDNLLAVVTDNRLIKLRAEQVILATGAVEQPMVFANNDLPGIMMGSAAQRLLWLYAVRPGRHAVVVTANGDGYGVALDLAEAGVTIQAVVDLREKITPDPRVEEAVSRRFTVLQGFTIDRAIANDGGHHLAAVDLVPTEAGDAQDSEHHRIPCDLLCVSTGWTPAASLAAHAGAAVAYDESASTFTVRDLPPTIQAAGTLAGQWDPEDAIAHGRYAGWRAAGADGDAPSLPDPKRTSVSDPFPCSETGNGKAFVDFDEDLTPEDIRNSIAEGFDHIELLKRFSTVGMGPSQGRQSVTNALRLLCRETGQPIQDSRGWTNRPPAFPEKIGQLAGRGFDPVRKTPMHDRHIEEGASMMVAGAWLRPVCYGANPAEAAAAEVRAVRNSVGLIDVSTLGGIDLRGPDSAEFLNRLYTMSYSKQPVGRGRYALMCDMTGAIMDDGVACRMAEDHFYVTATTGNSDGVYRSMLHWNAQWRLDVDIANMTGAFAAVNIAGPQSRRALEPLCEGVDLSASGFPYMAVGEASVAGIPARLMRVGFVGELGYEIHVPAGCGEALWDALTDAGRPYHCRTFGVEAQRILRLEKGHIIIGQDTDGLTHPHEAGMGWAVGKQKPFFVGKRAIDIQMARGLDRVLVGFTLPAQTTVLPEECHLVFKNGDIVGRVTSIVRSPTLGYPIGMAYVAPDQTEPGTPIHIKGPMGRYIQGTVTALPFYDPENTRQAG